MPAQGTGSLAASNDGSMRCRTRRAPRPDRDLSGARSPRSRLSPDGTLAVGARRRQLLIEAGADCRHCRPASAASPRSPSRADGALWLANGSDRQPGLGLGRRPDGEERVGLRLAASTPDGELSRRSRTASPGPPACCRTATALVVCESWRHRLVACRAPAAAPAPCSTHLPGYPGAAVAGGRRRRLARHLRAAQPADRIRAAGRRTIAHDMMASVPRDYWIAPALSSGRSFLEPLQCGGDPHRWASTSPGRRRRSYGLVVRLDAALAAASSLHSRANGTRHGIDQRRRARRRVCSSRRGAATASWRSMPAEAL